jgi:hypothetical protein
MGSSSGKTCSSRIGPGARLLDGVAGAARVGLSYLTQIGEELELELI